MFIYYDIQRYLNLHYGISEKIFTKYHLLKKNTSNKIIVSFTSSKIDRILPMVHSILDQSVRVDQMVLNIPSKFEDKRLSSSIRKFVIVKKSSIDYGIGNKCIPTVIREKDYGTIIILVKDNIVYGYDFIETIISESMRYPNKVIMCQGAILAKPEFFSKEILNVKGKITDEEIIKKYIKVGVRVLDYNHNIRRL